MILIIFLLFLAFIIPENWSSNSKNIGYGAAKSAGRAVRRSCYYGKRKRRR